MKKILIAVLAVALIGILAYKFVNKPIEDFASQKPVESFSMNDLIGKLESDTISLSKLKDQLVAVKGNVKKIVKDKEFITIEIGDSLTSSSIVCQVDERHLSDFENSQENSEVSLKGKLTGYTIDTDLGVFNSIEMKSCSLNK